MRSWGCSADKSPWINTFSIASGIESTSGFTSALDVPIFLGAGAPGFFRLRTLLAVAMTFLLRRSGDYTLVLVLASQVQRVKVAFGACGLERRVNRGRDLVILVDSERGKEEFKRSCLFVISRF